MLNQIKKEQEHLRRVVERERRQLTKAALEAVEERGHCRPFVVAWNDPNKRAFRFKLTSWESKEKRDEQFDHLRSILDDKDVIATLTLVNGLWTVNGSEKTAVMTVVRLPQMKEMKVHPFTVQQGGVEWDPVVELEDFEGGFLRYPQFS